MGPGTCYLIVQGCGFWENFFGNILFLTPPPQLFTCFYFSHICCILDQFLHQVIITKVSIKQQCYVGKDLLCKAMQCRIGQGRPCKCGACICSAVSQKRLTVKISCPCSIQSVHVMCYSTEGRCIIRRKSPMQFQKGHKEFGKFIRSR